MTSQGIFIQYEFGLISKREAAKALTRKLQNAEFDYNYADTLNSMLRAEREQQQARHYLNRLAA